MFNNIFFQKNKSCVIFIYISTPLWLVKNGDLMNTWQKFYRHYAEDFLRIIKYYIRRRCEEAGENKVFFEDATVKENEYFLPVSEKYFKRNKFFILYAKFFDEEAKKVIPQELEVMFRIFDYTGKENGPAKATRVGDTAIININFNLDYFKRKKGKIEVLYNTVLILLHEFFHIFQSESEFGMPRKTKNNKYVTFDREFDDDERFLEHYAPYLIQDMEIYPRVYEAIYYILKMGNNDKIKIKNYINYLLFPNYKTFIKSLKKYKSSGTIEDSIVVFFYILREKREDIFNKIIKIVIKNIYNEIID